MGPKKRDATNSVAKTKKTLKPISDDIREEQRKKRDEKLKEKLLAFDATVPRIGAGQINSVTPGLRRVKTGDPANPTRLIRTPPWLCLECFIPQLNNLRRHERERCYHRDKQNLKGLYPMNALGTDIERDDIKVRKRQLKRIHYVE